MKIIKAAAVYAAEQCLWTPRGEVYSFMATAGKVRITAKVEPEAKNEYLAVYCLGCGSQPRRLVLARQKDGTMTEVPHPAEKGVDYRYFLFGEDFAYAHYLRDDWYYREYYDWTVMSKNRQGVYEDISRQLAGAYKIAHVGRFGDCPGVLSVVVENGEEERRLLFEKEKGNIWQQRRRCWKFVKTEESFPVRFAGSRQQSLMFGMKLMCWRKRSG